VVVATSGWSLGTAGLLAAKGGAAAMAMLACLPRGKAAGLSGDGGARLCAGGDAAASDSLSSDTLS
jgi:hypothetical protein